MSCESSAKPILVCDYRTIITALSAGLPIGFAVVVIGLSDIPKGIDAFTCLAFLFLLGFTLRGVAGLLTYLNSRVVLYEDRIDRIAPSGRVCESLPLFANGKFAIRDSWKAAGFGDIYVLEGGGIKIELDTLGMRNVDLFIQRIAALKEGA